MSAVDLRPADLAPPVASAVPPEEPRRGSAIRTWSLAMRRLPAIAFLAVYIFTCYVGALALLLSERYRGLYLFMSGAAPPELTARDVLVAVVLLHAGPLLLWFGFEPGLRWTEARLRARAAGLGRVEGPIAVGAVAFFASVAWGCWSLYRTGGLANYGAWLDYNEYVYARWRLFATLSFFELVNLYTLLPLFAAYVILKERRWLTAALAGLLVGLLQAGLAQRKTLVTSAILIGVAAYIHLYLGREPRRRAAARWHLAVWIGAPASLYGLYVATTLLPIILESSHSFQAGRFGAPPPAVKAPPPPSGKVAVSFDWQHLDTTAVSLRDRKMAIAVYTVMAPLNRTSISAVVYPAIFPRWHPYYPVDLALDIARVGRMPDDNRIVYRILWPSHDAQGAIGAPFQFVLYSQGGLVVALVGSLAVGLAIGGFWAFVVVQRRPGPTASLFGSLVVVAATFVAMDSARNTITVSYGLAWAALAVLALQAAVWAEARIGREASA